MANFPRFRSVYEKPENEGTQTADGPCNVKLGRQRLARGARDTLSNTRFSPPLGAIPALKILMQPGLSNYMPLFLSTEK